MKRTAGALLALVGAVASVAARADIADGINAVRARGCADSPGVGKPLRRVRGLDEVAREWSRGGRLRDALARTDYRIVNSSSMHVEGARDDEALLEGLAAQYCDTILDPSFSEIGVFRRNRAAWIVVAEPFVAPRDARATGERVLRLVNEARAKSRRCGRTTLPAAPPLKSSALLDRAALTHAKDMAAHSLFEHRGSDASLPADRVTRVGYHWRSVGENIASGAADADAVVRGWLDSPGHCTNLMGAQYTEMGVAYVTDPKSKAGIYWAQVLASPRGK
jgi:uncharacterized protein YkwD